MSVPIACGRRVSLGGEARESVGRPSRSSRRRRRAGHRAPASDLCLNYVRTLALAPLAPLAVLPAAEPAGRKKNNRGARTRSCSSDRDRSKLNHQRRVGLGLRRSRSFLFTSLHPDQLCVFSKHLIAGYRWREATARLRPFHARITLSSIRCIE